MLYKNKQKDIISFFIRHPNYFITLISLNYPFSQYQLKLYKIFLDWDKISYNENITWSIDILNEFSKFICWDLFTINKSAFVNKDLLVAFEDRIDWYGHDNYSGDSIVANEGIYWDNETINKYADKININKLSLSTTVEWSEALLDKYIDKWDFIELAQNKSIQWSLHMFEKYLDESYFDHFFVETNEKLISFELVEKYHQFMNWHSISLIPTLPWIEKDLLNYWKDKIEWTGIACNTFLFSNDKNFYQKNYNKWQKFENKAFGFFSGNESFPWSKQMIETFKHDIDWNLLCSNEGIVWDIDLIDSFSKYVKWGGWEPSALYDENGDVISPVGGGKADIGLLMNESIPWSIDFLIRYENEIEDDMEFDGLLNNSAIWDKAFKPYMNEEMIKKIIRLL